MVRTEDLSQIAAENTNGIRRRQAGKTLEAELWENKILEKTALEVAES